MFGESFDFPLQASHPVPPNATVVITNLQGSVHVVGIDSKELTITGRKSIRAFDRPAAEQADTQTPIEITEQGGRILVRTNQDRVSSDRQITEDLEVSLPSNVALSIEGRSGDLEAKDIAGPIDINSNNAGVRLNNVAKNVKINVRRSDLVRATQLGGNIYITGRGRDVELEKVAGTVNIEGDFSGDVKLHDLAKPVHYTSSVTELSFEKLPGQIEMDLGQLHGNNIVGPFRLNARSKDVRLENFSKDVEITSRRGDIELRDPRLPLPNIHVQNQNGSIELELPSNAVFSLDARTGVGKVDNQFGPAVQVDEQSGKGKQRGATASKSGADQIRLSTDRGDIVLKKAVNIEHL